MASGQERALRRRIRSVNSTKKITRAMELIAASRIVKAQQRVAAARPYSEQITEVMRTLAASGAAGMSHPLLEERDPVSNVGYVVVAADRGLAGAYNATVLRTAERHMKGVEREGKGTVLVTSGRKAESYFRYRGYNLADAFTGYAEVPSYEDARRLAAAVVSRYEEGEIDRVELVYTRFLSLGVQRVTITRLLPLEREAIEGDKEHNQPQALYEIEPEPEAILAELLPRYVEARIFDALLQAAASEQAARQRAMKAATDNAEELIKKLQVTANKLRQASITTEIMEIVGGAEALRQAGMGSEKDYLPDTVLSRDILRDRLDHRMGAGR
ncbi:MAG: F0F1 ATP synthase subunit gamma [Acidimicrobiales bacterium]